MIFQCFPQKKQRSSNEISGWKTQTQFYFFLQHVVKLGHPLQKMRFTLEVYVGLKYQLDKYMRGMGGREHTHSMWNYLI